jgi:hypothetical protein
LRSDNTVDVYCCNQSGVIKAYREAYSDTQRDEPRLNWVDFGKDKVARMGLKKSDTYSQPSPTTILKSKLENEQATPLRPLVSDSQPAPHLPDSSQK